MINFYQSINELLKWIAFYEKKLSFRSKHKLYPNTFDHAKFYHLYPNNYIAHCDIKLNLIFSSNVKFNFDTFLFY